MLPNPAPPPESGSARSGPGRRPSRRAGRAAWEPSPGLIVLRVAIMALGLTIGIVLLTRGDLVLGVLLMAFAALRLGMFVSMRRRRREWRTAREGFRRPT